MKWGPKNWDWWPRLDELFGWLGRNVPRALLFPLYALFNIDRWPWRRIWQTLGWLPRNYFAVLAVLAVVVLPFWMWLIVQVAAKVIALLEPLPVGGTAEERRDLAYAFGVNVAALAGLVAAPLVIIRAWVSERHTKTAEEGLITERFTKAVEQLGVEKTVKVEGRILRYRYGPEGKPLSALEIRGEPLKLKDAAEIVETGEWQFLERTEPNLEVRLGAIYALERIAQDSERDHIPIMETLCAYIRENAPASSAREHHLGQWPDWTHDAYESTRELYIKALARRQRELRSWADSLPSLRVDVQAVLSVIGRRHEQRIAHERRHLKKI